MKPYLMLLFTAVCLAAIMPVHAQKSDVNYKLIASKHQVEAAPQDTGVLTVYLHGFATNDCFAKVELIPWDPNGLPVQTKIINAIGGCNQFCIFEDQAGITYYATATNAWGQKGTSAPVYLDGFWSKKVIDVYMQQ
jgi:hypothetical protein